ncbi:MAG: Ppx/GppA family phosphatase, partial [Prevotella sp.]|nr:Ppx/GppA family phosphatase [Prevotella sp.]
RADVIVPAASIFLMVADHSGAQRILVPSLGLADGIINDLM